jgi:uncharacterized protein involved in type VI secretion and phage assembly
MGLVSKVDAKGGRVKLTFPWFDEAAESNWAPIASLLSGKKRGARFMPEIGDEALVAFEHGDFRFPCVIGFMWNGEDEAPDDEKTNRLIVTPGGHELRFEDKEGDRRVVLRTDGEHVLSMDDKGASIALESAQGHKLQILDKDGKVTLTTKAGGKVTLENAPGTATVEASGNRIVLGPSGVTITVATGNLSVTASASTSINSTGSMSVQTTGPMTVESAAAVSVVSAAAVNVTAGSALSVTVGGAMTLTAPVVTVNAGMASFTGVLQATTVIASSVVSASYTPGAGNLI